MQNDIVSGTRALIMGLLVSAISPLDSAAADSITYRFEAERSRAQAIDPADSSLTALAAAITKLSGIFGFDIDTPVAATAGIPGRVEFGAYDTGFIKVNQLGPHIGGEFSVQVTDGVTLNEDPRMTIADEISVSTRAISTEEPVEEIILRIRYTDAERFQGIALPKALNLEDVAQMSLTFSIRIDAISNRGTGQNATGELLGLVHFDVTMIERIE